MRRSANSQNYPIAFAEGIEWVRTEARPEQNLVHRE